LHLLVDHQTNRITDQVRAYARYLSDLLSAHLGDSQSAASVGATFGYLAEKAGRGYVVIVVAAEHSSWWFRRLLGELVTPPLR
jgi:hypothetical protein